MLDPTMQLKCSFNIKAFYVDLFSQWGLFKKQQSPVDKAIHPDDLTSSWNGFVIAFKRSPSNWIEMSFNTARKKFIKSTMLGHVMDVHQCSMASGLSCGCFLNSSVSFATPAMPV